MSTNDPQDFDYDVTKVGKVLIYWRDKLVTTLANERARKFLQRIDAPYADPQQIMARVTGNFKRGNERDGKNRRQ